ncbi:hypothetical protein [Cupriavidus alkaliphilus]|uniref:hypothetical protein n=1 Tax=Cupriavidus alkaliphilus TaxID=942866 RepID=UPI001615F390|nr:hypothetical protein [Cupriavidus alkaliphilus]MBB2917198.1 hypothetical protein [Cupriavidus alkaliphilus]
MSNSDDVKPPGPPTLFGNEPDAGAAGQTRILASLEGRVPMAAKAPASKPGRRYVAGGLVAVAAAAVAGWLWLDPGADAPVTMQADKPSAPAQAGADASAPGTQALAGHAAGSSPATAVAPPEGVHAAEPPQPQAATIVDAGSSDPVLDSLGKVDGATAAAGALAGATTLAALTALGSQPATARPQSAEISKSSKKASSAKTASSAAKSTTNAANSKDKAAAAKSSTAAKPTRTARRKASSAAADPDAEVLAALLSQPEGKPISTAAASTRPSAKARN